MKFGSARVGGTKRETAVRVSVHSFTQTLASSGGRGIVSIPRSNVLSNPPVVPTPRATARSAAHRQRYGALIERLYMGKKTPNKAVSKLLTEATIEALQDIERLHVCRYAPDAVSAVGAGAVLMGISRVDNDKDGDGSATATTAPTTFGPTPLAISRSCRFSTTGFTRS